MRTPKSRPSSSARSCRMSMSPWMRRDSSSSWESRPVVPIESTARAMTTAMMTSTTRISTSVKPLLRTVRHGRGLSLFEGGGADVRVVALTARLSVAPVADDVVVAAVGARAHVLIGVVPRILGKGGQIASRAVIGDRRIVRLRHQSLQALLGGRVFEIIQTIQVQRGLDGPDVARRTGDTRLVDVLQNPGHDERPQDCENDDDDHDLDQGETALALMHS